MTLSDDISQWISEQVGAAGLSGAVVGLSGGIDSAVVSGLCARALGPENVLGIIMPAHSSPADEQDAELVAREWGIEYKTIDLSRMYDEMLQLIGEGNDLARANVKPRLRMITLYYHANTLNRMVVGTGNRSELLVGYFTKYGDAGVDLLPIAGLYKHQVWELASEIGVPQSIIDRPPSAGLWEGQTDEQEMGVSYADLDRVLAAMQSGADVDVDPDVRDKVARMHRNSEHKRHLPPIFHPEQR